MPLRTYIYDDLQIWRFGQDKCKVGRDKCKVGSHRTADVHMLDKDTGSYSDCHSAANRLCKVRQGWPGRKGLLLLHAQEPHISVCAAGEARCHIGSIEGAHSHALKCLQTEAQNEVYRE